jgi:hypothetical protein
MCRLYSSPNKFSWIAEVGSDCLFTASHALVCTESWRRSKSSPFGQSSRSTKTRSPTAGVRRRRQIIHLAETSPALLRMSSSAKSGFHWLYGQEQHSFSHCAQKTFAFWNR